MKYQNNEHDRQNFYRILSASRTKNHSGCNRSFSLALSMIATLSLLLLPGCDSISSSEDIDLKEDTINTAVGAWEPLDTGFHQTVLSLTIHNGDLIAGGYFGGLNYVARWDGTTWHPMGSPALSSAPGALTVYDGDLIAGGSFSTKRGQTVDGIARWDGSEWHSVGTGIEFRGDADVSVEALTVYDGDLIAAGSFTTAGGQSAKNIARWNGSEWEPLGSGFEYNISALIVHNGYLIAGGEGILSRWNGSEWHTMGGGNVHTLAIHEGDLYAAGYINGAAVSRWNGLTWQSVGTTEGYATSFSIHAGNLIAGGESPNTLGEGTNHIARWDGLAWQSIGSGMNGSIIALTVHDGDLIAAGSFTTAGGQKANNIARWVTP
jgi:hypothetical protein